MLIFGGCRNFLKREPNTKLFGACKDYIKNSTLKGQDLDGNSTIKISMDTCKNEVNIRFSRSCGGPEKRGSRNSASLIECDIVYVLHLNIYAIYLVGTLSSIFV